MGTQIKLFASQKQKKMHEIKFGNARKLFLNPFKKALYLLAVDIALMLYLLRDLSNPIL